MAIYRIKGKLFAGAFDPGTYNSMVNAAANNATPDAQRMLDGYSKKYAEDITKYKNSTALTTVKPNANIPTGTNPPNKVGAWQGIKNSWETLGKSKFGTAKQAGIIGAGVLGAGLMAKGLFGGNSSKETAFSEDTSGALREAALIGTGLTMVGGGMYLAKKGKLGFTKAQKDTNKKAYDKISGEVKKIVSETKKESGKPAETTTVAETTTKAAGKKPKTTVVVEKSIPRYKDSDWKNIRRELKGTGGDFRNPSDVAKAAAKVGAKPL